jgi:hypothetical protein
MIKGFKSHFRYNKRIKHPTYVYSQVKNNYRYIGLTHSSITKGKQNFKLNDNPNPKDSRPCFARPKAKMDKIKNFGSQKLNKWKLSKRNKKIINKIK